ncbi:hypothetical protein PR048_003377 [Dryococelus australis]|uniref:Uncharacterized protein n=1 Tax=Dryococelus australis TaxID=614101 RepID=A0ABQ9IMX1_9NEOP|nr:hypothetical protein PR048_003377 [Dryococelus australis]
MWGTSLREARTGNESAMACHNEPSQNSPGIISGNHGETEIKMAGPGIEPAVGVAADKRLNKSSSRGIIRPTDHWRWVWPRLGGPGSAAFRPAGRADSKSAPCCWWLLVSIYLKLPRSHHGSYVRRRHWHAHQVPHRHYARSTKLASKLFVETFFLWDFKQIYLSFTYIRSAHFDIRQSENAVFSYVRGLGNSGSNMRSVMKATFRHRLEFFCSDKDETATHNKCAIAAKRKSFNWRAEFLSHCVYLRDFKRYGVLKNPFLGDLEYPEMAFLTLDSSVLCILELQLCVHWLLPHTGSYRIREVFSCKSAIGSEACRPGPIDCDPIAKAKYQLLTGTFVNLLCLLAAGLSEKTSSPRLDQSEKSYPTLDARDWLGDTLDVCELESSSRNIGSQLTCFGIQIVVSWNISAEDRWPSLSVSGMCVILHAPTREEVANYTCECWLRRAFRLWRYGVCLRSRHVLVARNGNAKTHVLMRGTNMAAPCARSPSHDWRHEYPAARVTAPPLTWQLPLLSARR